MQRAAITGLLLLALSALGAPAKAAGAAPGESEEESNVGLTSFGFIVTGAGYDPAEHRAELAWGRMKTIVVGVSKPEQGPAVAQELVAEGVQLIELCGGFGPLWTARVIEAVERRVPVGSVAYGPESIDQMHALFAD